MGLGFGFGLLTTSSRSKIAIRKHASRASTLTLATVSCKSGRPARFRSERHLFVPARSAAVGCQAGARIP